MITDRVARPGHLRSVIEAPVTGHSRKPDEFYALVERLYPGGPFMELFARQRRRGWTCCGDELSAGLGSVREKRMFTPKG